MKRVLSAAFSSFQLQEEKKTENQRRLAARLFLVRLFRCDFAHDLRAIALCSIILRSDANSAVTPLWVPSG